MENQSSYPNPDDSTIRHTNLRVDRVSSIIRGLIIQGYILQDGLQGKKAVDLGCWLGASTKVLRQYGTDVIGVDTYGPSLKRGISYGLLEGGRVAEKEGLEYLRGLPNKCIDLVTVFAAEDGLNLLFVAEESLRVLKESGRMVFTATKKSERQFKRLERASKKPHGRLINLGLEEGLLFYPTVDGYWDTQGYIGKKGS